MTGGDDRGRGVNLSFANCGGFVNITKVGQWDVATGTELSGLTLNPPPIVEQQLRDLFYNDPVRPGIVGKRNAQDDKQIAFVQAYKRWAYGDEKTGIVISFWELT